MPHLALVEDQSDSGSAATQQELTLEQLGLNSSGSDTDSTDDTENNRKNSKKQHKTRKKTKRKRKTRKPTDRALPARGYLFEDKVNVDDIMDPHDMGLQVLQARRKGKMALFKAPVKYMDSVKGKIKTMCEKKEGRPEVDIEHWGDQCADA